MTDESPPTPVPGPGTLIERAIPRLVVNHLGKSREALAEAVVEHGRLMVAHEPRLTVLVAKTLVEHLPPIETWTGAIFSYPEDGMADDVVLIPREQALEACDRWPSMRRALSEPMPDRLDVVIHTRFVGLVISLDVEPALPVTRKQAEAAHLPTHLLFAKGDSFVSVGDPPVDESSLLGAWTEHRRLVEEHCDEVLEDLRKVAARQELADCVGVVLQLGEEGRAVSVVTRDQARKVLDFQPFLARKMERRPATGKAADGREVTAFPIVVWAKGHLSVQSRDIVTRA